MIYCPLRIPGLEESIELEVHASGDRHVSAQIREHGIWEPYETALVRQYLSEGDTFLDIGANLGYYAVLGALAVGEKGRVFAFEPEPDNFQLLQRNLQRNALAERADCFAVALSDAEGEMPLYLNEHNRGDHGRAFFDPLARHHFRTAHSSDNDVRANGLAEPEGLTA